MTNIEMFAVVSADGRLYYNRFNRPCIYDTVGKAQKQADVDGDSVVHVTVHLDQEPVFIRSKKVT